MPAGVSTKLYGLVGGQDLLTDLLTRLTKTFTKTTSTYRDAITAKICGLENDKNICRIVVAVDLSQFMPLEK